MTFSTVHTHTHTHTHTHIHTLDTNKPGETREGARGLMNAVLNHAVDSHAP